MRLLLAEDEKSLSRALCAILAKNNSSVEAVYDGQDALDYLLSGESDRAVLDVMMPKMDGFTVLRKIREKGITIPVMMLTARSEIDDKVEGLDLGANDYLTKPFESRELLARLRAITRSVATAADNSLRFGNIVLDRKSFELSGPSGSVRLAAKEYQMMEYLMSNPGALISTDRFMEKVWGLDSDADINVVWTNLSYLRKKLTSVGSDVKIKAARNAGYFLEVEK
jgi:DNA-binding response OmpR family regulator